MAIEGIGQLVSIGNYSGIFRWILYSIPIIFGFAVLMFIFFYIRRSKLFNIDIDLIIVTGDNMVRARDKGGIINKDGVEKLVLKMRKKSMAIPPRKYWMLNDKGRFTITLFRYGENDFSPVATTPLKEILNSLHSKKTIMSEMGKYPEDKSLKVKDVKKDFSELDSRLFIPMPSDSKSHHLVNTRLINLRNQQTKTVDKLIAMIPYAIVGICFFFLIFYGTQWYNGMMDKAMTANKGCLETSKEVLQDIDLYCLRGETPTKKISEEDMPKPPI